MPYHQIVDMICALQTAGVSEDDYKTFTITNNNNDEHAFQYWDTWDGVPGGPSHRIHDDVVNFLDTYLK